MKYVNVIWVFLTLFFIVPKNIEARSGCCSHHGGVCGCGCCDGTSLSTTCAPYYPQCNSTVVVPKVVRTPTPTPKPTFLPTVKPSVRPTVVPTSTPTVLLNNSSEDHSDSWTTAIVASLVGAGVYHLFAKKKSNTS